MSYSEILKELIKLNREMDELAIRFCKMQYKAKWHETRHHELLDAVKQNKNREETYRNIINRFVKKDENGCFVLPIGSKKLDRPEIDVESIIESIYKERTIRPVGDDMSDEDDEEEVEWEEDEEETPILIPDKALTADEKIDIHKIIKETEQGK